MAHQTPDRPDDQLSTLLSDLDAAVRARFGEALEREEAGRSRRPVLGLVVVALRRFVGAVGRARSAPPAARRDG